MVTSLTPYPYAMTPISNITPFTYADGITYLEKLELLRVWLNENLVPDVNGTLESLITDFQTGIKNAELTTTESEARINALIDTMIAELTTAFDNRVILGANSNVVPAPAPSGGDDLAALTTLTENNPGKTIALQTNAVYKLSDFIPLKGSLLGNGATLDFSTMPTAPGIGQRYALKAAGTLDQLRVVSNPIVKMSRVITGIATTSGLAVGDLILLTNDERPVPGMSRTDRDKGELGIIVSIDSDSQITLANGVSLDYGTFDLKIQKVNPVDGLTIRDLKIKMRGVGSAHNGIEIQYGRNINIENVSVNGAEDVAISLRTVINGNVNGCDVRNSTSPSFSSTGYGVSIVDGSRDCKVSGNNFYNCRHFIAGGGFWPAIYIDISDNHGTKSISAAYDCHEPCFYWTFRGNSATGVTNGFGIRGQYVTVEDNLVVDCPGRSYDAGTVDGVTEQRGIRFLRNRAIGVKGFGISLDGQATSVEPKSLKIDCEIVGNVLRDCGGDSIIARHFQGVSILNNTVIGAVRHGVLALGLAANAANQGITEDLPSTRLVFGGNVIKSPGGDGIQLNLVDDISFTGDMVYGALNHGIEVIKCNRTSFSGVSTRYSAYSGILLSGGTQHSLVGCLVSGGTNVNYDAFRSTNSSDVTISGGYYAGGRTGVATTGAALGDRVIVTGVNAKSTLGASKITSDAVTQVIVNNIV